MAYIYNIKTTVSTECLNKDVIKICRSDPLNYIVSDSLDDLNKQIKQLEGIDESIKPKKPVSKMKLDELKAYAEELGIENIDSLTKEELIAVIKQNG